MTEQQRDLFSERDPVPSPLGGLKVKLDRTVDRARPCCSNVCIIKAGKGCHAGALYCTTCDRFRGWLSKSTAQWIASVIARFGKPDRPIVMRDRTHRLPAVVGADSGRDANAPEQELTKMDMSQYAGGKYLKVADLKESGPLRVTIVEVGISEKYAKPELTLDDGSILSCNTTNTNRLIRAYGAESDDWIGKEIELDLGEVDYQGQPQEAVLGRSDLATASNEGGSEGSAEAAAARRPPRR